MWPMVQKVSGGNVFKSGKQEEEEEEEKQQDTKLSKALRLRRRQKYIYCTYIRRGSVSFTNINEYLNILCQIPFAG